MWSNTSERMDYRKDKITTVPQTKQSNSCLLMLCIKPCGPVSSKAIKSKLSSCWQNFEDVFDQHAQIISTFLHGAVYMQVQTKSVSLAKWGTHSILQRIHPLCKNLILSQSSYNEYWGTVINWKCITLCTKQLECIMIQTKQLDCVHILQGMYTVS